MSRQSFIDRDRNHGTVSHRRSKKQEQSLAVRSGGRLVPGSGCGPQKGDVAKAYGVFRLEAKTTKNRSFSVTRDMVAKLEEAALNNQEVPAMVIEFIDETGKPLAEVAVVPTYLLPEIAKHHAD